MAPTISVVMPCHNNGPYVAEAVASVLAQTLPISQFIFVDDACTDDSVAQAKKVAGPITVVRGKFGSCAAARNAGMHYATADLVAFLDADDVWPPDSVAARCEGLRSNSAEICFGRVRQTWLDVGERAKPVGTEMVGRLAGSMLVVRKVFDRIGLFDERLRVSEAIDWVARAADAGVAMAACRELVLYRRVHHANTMRLTENVDRLPLQALRNIVSRRSRLAAGAA